MALTTVAGAIDGLLPDLYNIKSGSGGGATGRVASLWYAGGSPAGASINASGMSGAALSGTQTGAFKFLNHPTGETILAGATARNVTSASMLLIVDRLWHNSGINMTLTTAQTINSVAWPARDVNASTNGEGVYIGVEIATTTGAGTPTLSMTYTNSAGTGSRVSSNVIATSASVPAGNFYVMGLQAGDTGVRSIQDFTLSATWTTGAIVLVAFRVIAAIPLPGNTAASTRFAKRVEDALTLCAPRIWNDSVLQAMIVCVSGSAPQSIGTLKLSQG